MQNRQSGTTWKPSLGTMHLAKDPKFGAVAAMACDDQIIRLQERLETVGDEADLQEA